MDTDLGLQCFCIFIPWETLIISNTFCSLPRKAKALVSRADVEPQNTALTYLYANFLQTHSSH